MDEETFRRECDSISTYGFVDPVTVVELADGLFRIIDGEQRVRAAQALGLGEVPCFNLGPSSEVSEARQRALTVTLNDLRGKHDRDKLAQVIGEIMHYQQVGERIVLPYAPEVVTNYLSISEAIRQPLDLVVPAHDGPQKSKRHIPERRTLPAPVLPYHEWSLRLPEPVAERLRLALDQALLLPDVDEDWQAFSVLAEAYLAKVEACPTSAQP